MQIYQLLIYELRQAFRQGFEYINPILFFILVVSLFPLALSAEPKLLAIPDLKLIGTAKPKVGVISFVLKEIHPHDIGTVLDHEGIAVRAGHHCAMPLMERYQIPAAVRASFGIYNNEKDIESNNN